MATGDKLKPNKRNETMTGSPFTVNTTWAKSKLIHVSYLLLQMETANTRYNYNYQRQNRIGNISVVLNIIISIKIIGNRNPCWSNACKWCVIYTRSVAMERI